MEALCDTGDAGISAVLVLLEAIGNVRMIKAPVDSDTITLRLWYVEYF